MTEALFEQDGVLFCWDISPDHECCVTAIKLPDGTVVILDVSDD